MKKLIRKISIFIFAMITTILIANVSDAHAWTVKSAVTRNDGIWLFPISSSDYFLLTDWAGCSANY